MIEIDARSLTFNICWQMVSCWFMLLMLNLPLLDICGLDPRNYPCESKFQLLSSFWLDGYGKLAFNCQLVAFKCWCLLLMKLTPQISNRWRYSISNINQQLTICQQMLKTWSSYFYLCLQCYEKTGCIYSETFCSSICLLKLPQGVIYLY